jgi:hypothetical protein
MRCVSACSRASQRPVQGSSSTPSASQRMLTAPTTRSAATRLRCAAVGRSAAVGNGVPTIGIRTSTIGKCPAAFGARGTVFGAKWAALSARGSSLRRDVASAQSEGSSLQRAAASMPVSTCLTAESPVHFSRGWEFVDWTRLVSARYTPGRAPWIPLTGTVDPFDANAVPSFETAHPLGENADARRAGRARLLDARGRDGAVLSQRARR